MGAAGTCTTDAISRSTLKCIVLLDRVVIMKSNETKTRFVELRAQGLPLAKIAAEIKVNKTTLINWDRSSPRRSPFCLF